MTKWKTAAFVLAIGSAISAVALAQDHPFYRAAVAACSGKNDGDACQFQGRNHVVNGTCRKAPQTGDLVCWHPHHHRQ